MMLLTPLIMVPIFGTMIFRGSGNLPELVRPLMAIGAIGITLFGTIQMMGNQFGFDRDGFRVFVLSAASRKDILLGKNLSFLPVILPLAGLLMLGVEVFYPMRVDHFVGLVPQAVTMFLMFCLLANLQSIIAPFHVAAGAMKPASPKMSTVMLQLLIFMVVFPLTQGLTLLPLGAEALARFLGWTDRTPVFLLLALVECGAAVVLYHYALGWLGTMLQAREKRILEAVTKPS